jgi:2-polyprenyl-6-methoxyphenol hydroxylase-like FAD-dependent oxidoreductase
VSVEEVSYAGDTLDVTYRHRTTGETETIHEVHLLIGADGRFSKVRETFFPPAPSRLAGMGICRLLSESNGQPQVLREYGQWFHGPHRLLGFELPGGATYATATFPIEIEGTIPEELKEPANLRRLFLPDAGPLCPEAAFILDCLERDADKLHWARFQESDFLWEDDRAQVLLIGDACHAMLPTLGQGATQAIEDACVIADTLSYHADPADPLGSVRRALRHYRRRREARVIFCAQFSVEASDTLMPGTDAVNDTLRKGRRPFTDNLRQLYCDTPEPLAS